MAPTAAVGQVYIVARESVDFLDIPMQAAVGPLTEWGVGLSKVHEV
jgi:hypothetical protein